MHELYCFSMPLPFSGTQASHLCDSTIISSILSPSCVFSRVQEEKVGFGNGRSGLGGSLALGTITALYASGAAALHQRETLAGEQRVGIDLRYSCTCMHKFVTRSAIVFQGFRVVESTAGSEWQQKASSRASLTEIYSRSRHV